MAVWHVVVCCEANAALRYAGLQKGEGPMIYLVRHAKAQPRLWGEDSPDRCLTDQGHQQANNLAAWFGQLSPMAQMLLTSPFQRCVETAQPIATALNIPLSTVPWLSHGASVQRCLAKLSDWPAGQVQIWVGHEPELSCFLASVLQRDPGDLAFSKAGVAALRPTSGGWQLSWQYRYKQLLASK